MITRLRYGLATNSSSSHSMVTLPPDTTLEEINLDHPLFLNGYRLTTEPSKRHFLAANLRDQAPELWGKDVLIDPPDDQSPHDMSDGLNTRTREAWDSSDAPRDKSGNLPGWINLPTWLTQEINRLAGLPLETDLSHHTAHNSMGRPFEIPRAKGGLGPDPVAWEAIQAVILDPQTVVFAPEENRWDEDAEKYPFLPFEQAVARRSGLTMQRERTWTNLLREAVTPGELQTRLTYLQRQAAQHRLVIIADQTGGAWQVSVDPTPIPAYAQEAVRRSRWEGVLIVNQEKA